MGNHSATVKRRETEAFEVEIDSINEEIDVSSTEECNLYYIIQSAKTSIFEEWLERIPHIIRIIDEHGNNLIHLAAYLNRCSMIRHLSQYVDVNVPNNFGDTPIHIAASKGYKECIEALLGNGANVNVKNKCGSTPLHSVTMLGRNDCVEILLGYGANVNLLNCRNKNVQPTTIEPEDFIVRKSENQYLPKFADDITIEAEERNIEDLTESFGDSSQEANSPIMLNASISELVGAPMNMSFQHDFNAENDPLFQPALQKNCFRAVARTITIGRQMKMYENKVCDLEDIEDNDGDSPLQCAINSKNLAIFNLMIDHATTLKVTDDASYRLVEKAMSMNVPGVLRCLLSRPYEESNEEFTTDYLEQRLSSCIGKQGKNICVDYTPLVPSTFRNMETLLLIFLGISRDNNFEGLLQHPTIRCFLQWRWNQIAKYFYMNLYFFLLVCLNIIIYKSQYYCKNEKMNYEGYISYIFLLLNLIPVILREAFQIRINWRLYLLNSENYFEVSLIIYSVVLLIWYPADIATRIQISAIGNILIAVSVTLQIGQHPWAASAVHLLKVVAYRFLRHFIVYIGILIGFAYSFHELHSIDKLDTKLGASNSTSEETDNLNWLEFAGFTILRTAGMFIGELNLGDFNVDKSNYVLITILFLFILFVSIMMLNLLNGLAVSNIFEKEELKISHFKTRIQYLYSLNSKINLIRVILQKFPKFLQVVFNVINPESCNNNKNISNILILPTYLSRKDLKISDDAPCIHNNKIHKDAYDRLQRNRLTLNLKSV